ncbi:MAG: TetR family transcriptional regulator [Acidimicrobiales bacterium]
MARALAREIRKRNWEQMLLELEAVALELFEVRGYGIVTVDELASEAGISPRTFYRYFPAKEDVLQVRIDQRSAALRRALAEQPEDEPPIRSLSRALADVVSAEDPELHRRWVQVIQSAPETTRSVLGGIYLKSNGVMAEFLGSRLGLPAEDLMPTMLAAAAGGVLIAANTQWYLEGGSLARRITDGFAALEEFVSDGRRGLSSR